MTFPGDKGSNTDLDPLCSRVKVLLQTIQFILFCFELISQRDHKNYSKCKQNKTTQNKTKHRI